MIFAYSIFVASIFTAVVAIPAPSTSNKCHTIDSGYLSTFITTAPGNGADKALDLDSKKELTFGNGKAIKAAFQACPDLNNVEFNSEGRIVLEPISSNQCLTITNPTSSTGPYYAKAEKCTSNTKPSAGQRWGYGNDFGNVIFYTGSTPCSGGAGANLKSDDTLQLGTRNRIELTCTSQAYQSLTLTKTKG